MEERIYSGLMRFLCTPNPYFLLRCWNSLDERCYISRSLFQKLFQYRWCPFKILEYYSIYKHIINFHIVNFFSGFIASCTTSSIKHTNNVLNRYVGIVRITSQFIIDELMSHSCAIVVGRLSLFVTTNANCSNNSSNLLNSFFILLFKLLNLSWVAPPLSNCQKTLKECVCVPNNSWFLMQWLQRAKHSNSIGTDCYTLFCGWFSFTNCNNKHPLGAS